MNIKPFILSAALVLAARAEEEPAPRKLLTSPRGDFFIEEVDEADGPADWIVSKADSAKRARLTGPHDAEPHTFSISPDEKWICADVHRAIAELFAQRPRPTGFVFGAPENCLTALCHFLNAGMRIPTEAALISGWDDLSLRYTVPAISRYRIDGAKMGRKIASMLLDVIRHGPGKTRTARIIPDFVPGGTLGLLTMRSPRARDEACHPRLYHNNQDGTFTDVAPTIGLDMTLLGMAGNYGDLDNDGFLDFYIGTGEPSYTALVPNRMFRNAAGKKFQDVTTSGGFGNLQKGHGVAFADFNNDGQQDIYEVLGGAFTGDKYYTALYANPGHKNHWVKLKLEGVESNRSALGATIRVIAATPAGERSIYRTVSTGGSFGAGPLRIHVGLGDAESIKGIEIFWPKTGKTQRIPGVPMDKYYTIKEGAPAAVPEIIRSFPFLSASD